MLAAVNTVLDVAYASVVIWLVASQRILDPAFATALNARQWTQAKLPTW